MSKYRTLHPTADCTFFWAHMETLHKTDHVLGPKASPQMFQRIKITQSMTSDHSVIELETHEQGGGKEQNSSFWHCMLAERSQPGDVVLVLDINNLTEYPTSDKVALRSWWKEMKQGYLVHFSQHRWSQGQCAPHKYQTPPSCLANMAACCWCPNHSFSLAIICPPGKGDLLRASITELPLLSDSI